jgi:hypothetical protein
LPAATAESTPRSPSKNARGAMNMPATVMRQTPVRAFAARDAVTVHREASAGHAQYSSQIGATTQQYVVKKEKNSAAQ